jgi:thiol-disulfide isomerase/thioredoxin
MRSLEVVTKGAWRAASFVAICVAVMASALADDMQIPSLSEVLASDFQVRALDGSTISLADLVGAGRPVVIEFWATWCTPCRKTLPHLIRVKKEHAEALVVIGLTVEDPIEDASRVRAFAEHQKLNFPVAFAPNEVFQFMNRRTDIAVPKLFVFDATGELVAYVPRYSPLTPHKLESAIKKALSRDPGR